MDLNSTDTKSKEKIAAPRRVITGSKKIVFRGELNLGGDKRQKGSGFHLNESETAQMTLRIDRRLPRASHPSHRVIDRPNGKGEGLVLVYRDRSPRGSSIRISTSFESLWRPGLFF